MWPQVNATALQPPGGRVIGQAANLNLGLGAEGTRLYLADANFVPPSSQLDLRFTLEPTAELPLGSLMNPLTTTMDQQHTHSVLQSKQGGQNWGSDFVGMSSAQSNNTKPEPPMKPITNVPQYGFANRGPMQNAVNANSNYQRPQHDPSSGMCRDPNCMGHSPTANAGGRMIQNTNSGPMMNANRWHAPGEPNMQKLPNEFEYEAMRRNNMQPPGMNPYGPPMRKQNEPLGPAFGGASQNNAAYTNAAHMSANQVAGPGPIPNSGMNPNAPAPFGMQQQNSYQNAGGPVPMATPPMGRHPEIEQQRNAVSMLERIEMLALNSNVKLEFLVSQESPVIASTSTSTQGQAQTPASASEKAQGDQTSRQVRVRLGEEEYVGRGRSAQAAQLDAISKALAATRLPVPNVTQIARIRNEQAATEANHADTAQAKCLTKTVEVNNWCSKHRFDAVYSLVEREVGWSGDANQAHPYRPPFRRSWHHFERSDPTDFIAHLRIERHGVVEWDFFGLARTKKDARQEAARNVFTAIKAVRFVEDSAADKAEVVAAGVSATGAAPSDSAARQLNQPSTRKWVERRCHELVKSRLLTAQNSDLARVLLIARRFRWKVDVTVIGEKGPPHAKQFTAACIVSENAAGVRPGENDPSKPPAASEAAQPLTEADGTLSTNANAYSALANGLGDAQRAPSLTAADRERWTTKYRVEATDSTKKAAKLRAAKAMLETLRNAGEVDRYEALARDAEERERARACERDARRIQLLEREATHRLRVCIDFYDGLCILSQANRLGGSRPRLAITFLEDENAQQPSDAAPASKPSDTPDAANTTGGDADAPKTAAPDSSTKPKTTSEDTPKQQETTNDTSKSDAGADGEKSSAEPSPAPEKRALDAKRDRFSAELRLGDHVTTARGPTKRFVRDSVAKEMLERLGFRDVVDTVTQNRAQSDRHMFGRLHAPPGGYGGYAPPPFPFCGPPPFAPPPHGPGFAPGWSGYTGAPWFPFGAVPPYMPPVGIGVGGPLYTDFGTPPESGDDQHSQTIREADEDDHDSDGRGDTDAQASGSAANRSRHDSEASDSGGPASDDATSASASGTQSAAGSELEREQTRANAVFVESADGGRYVPIPESLKLVAQQCSALMLTVRYTLRMAGTPDAPNYECIVVVGDAGVRAETEYRGSGADERTACDEAARAANRELERKLLSELDELKFD